MGEWVGARGGGGRGVTLMESRERGRESGREGKVEVVGKVWVIFINLKFP